MDEIIEFLSLLSKNNNREWFQNNKEQYIAALKKFEQLCNLLLLRLADFDKDMQNVVAKDSIYRIYRDIRFSNDKTPYKTHFGAYLAFPNGRKSHRAGYYFHIEPSGSFLGIGVWRPEKNILNEIRKTIYYEYDALQSILNEKSFIRKFGTQLYEKDKLKRLPAGFSKDFPESELLKYRHYLINHSISNYIVKSDDCLDYLVDTARTGYPFLAFLNNVIDGNS